MAQFQKAVKAVAKKLTITMFDRDVPEYEFTGEWAGRDIKVVGRTISRAYHKLQLAARRKLMAENPTIGGLATSDNTHITPTTEETV